MACEESVPQQRRERLYHRVAHRPFCRACAGRLIADSRKQERWALGLAYAGLAAKTLVYVLLFVWAGRSEVGAAALHGAVIADVLTFLLLTLFDLPFKGYRFTVDGAFELALVLLFVGREALFDISTDVSSVAMAFVFFMLFAPIRLALWSLDQISDR